MITKQDKLEITEAVMRGLSESRFCNTCKMETEGHVEAHEALEEIIPSFKALEKFLNNVNSIKWSVIKYLVIVGIIALLALVGVKVGG
jgi:hypothetical protein